MEFKNIQAEDIYIGKNTIIEPSVKITGIKGKAKKIYIGDNCYIVENVQIICNDFSMGDYCKIHHDTNIHGYLPCKIGHNAWIGQFSIIDSIGGMTIGNNCGIGAHSQLWSHIKFGDTLEGCRFLMEKPMAMVGSVITKDMAYNEIYAGSPAKSISEKVGFQFLEVDIQTKFDRMNEYLKEFNPNSKTIKIVNYLSEISDNDDISYFIVSTRTYIKRGTNEEIDFMKFLLPAKAKFTPHLL